ncbi:MAG: ATP-grasp domain-containing protein [Candidatus Methylacidiphilales bacterium]
MDPDGYNSLPADTRVMMAPLKHINAEYRCLAVLGEIVTASRYKLNGRIQYTAGGPPEILNFAAMRVKEWQPRQAFILDIADTEEGPKIIETNSVSSAGYYAMDMHRYVEAINRLDGA